MSIYQRLLQINLPKHQSAFLWGGRKTGKTTYLQAVFPKALYYDLLVTETLVGLTQEPGRLRQEVLASKDKWTQPIIIDEVQKIPALLNEVHWLIENTPCQFILCGSSARKLKRGAANLLGGRAWSYHFYPFFYLEIPHFDLLRAFNHGLIPKHYLTDDVRRSLKAYVTNYLKEEILDEGLSRDLPMFSRFLDVAAFSSGELLNYSAIASESHIDSRTVKNYFQILQDTLIGYLIYPYAPKMKRKLITSTPKFYFFDVGVANYLSRIILTDIKGPQAGKSFEQFILMELMGYRGVNDYDYDIHYWRAKTGHEVDFILNRGEIAIEVKLNDSPKKSDLSGIIMFQKDYNPKQAYVVCTTPKSRLLQTPDGDIVLIPWQDFLKRLWAGEIIAQ